MRGPLTTHASCACMLQKSVQAYESREIKAVLNSQPYQDGSYQISPEGLTPLKVPLWGTVWDILVWVCLGWFLEGAHVLELQRKGKEILTSPLWMSSGRDCGEGSSKVLMILDPLVAEGNLRSSRLCVCGLAPVHNFFKCKRSQKKKS